MKKISIIMPYLNEREEPIRTIRSIYDTAPSGLFDIIAVDDASSHSPLDFSQFKDVRCFRNEERMGVDASRQLGVDEANTPYIFIIDAHMTFKKDNWMEKIISCLEREPETAWCTVCLALGYGVNDVYKSKSRYYGANMLFVNPDTRKDRQAREILEPKWAKKRDGLEYEIPCILGANYAFSKKWFDHINGLRGLKMWGSSEPFLSMKTWMAGGKCKIRTDIEIGHLFRKNAPYVTKVASLVYNKIFMCKTIFPDELAGKLIGYLPKDRNFRAAQEFIDAADKEIQLDRKYYQNIFNKSIYDYCNKFGIQLPK